MGEMFKAEFTQKGKITISELKGRVNKNARVWAICPHTKQPCEMKHKGEGIWVCLHKEEKPQEELEERVSRIENALIGITQYKHRQRYIYLNDITKELTKHKVMPRMGQKKCAICLCDIPNYSREALINLGYAGFQIPANSKQKYFCPKHSPKEKAEYIARKAGLRRVRP